MSETLRYGRGGEWHFFLRWHFRLWGGSFTLTVAAFGWIGTRESSDQLRVWSLKMQGGVILKQLFLGRVSVNEMYYILVTVKRSCGEFCWQETRSKNDCLTIISIV